MTLPDLCEHIKTAFERLQAVKSYHLGDVYAYLNSSSVKYANVCADLKTIRTDEQGEVYTFTIYASEREKADGSNEYANYDELHNILELGLNYLNDIDGITVLFPRNYTVAHQKFMDVLTVMFIDVNIEVERDIIGDCYNE